MTAELFEPAVQFPLICPPGRNASFWRCIHCGSEEDEHFCPIQTSAVPGRRHAAELAGLHDFATSLEQHWNGSASRHLGAR
jgi:hypothetical protein